MPRRGSISSSLGLPRSGRCGHAQSRPKAGRRGRARLWPVGGAGGLPSSEVSSRTLGNRWPFTLESACDPQKGDAPGDPAGSRNAGGHRDPLVHPGHSGEGAGKQQPLDRPEHVGAGDQAPECARRDVECPSRWPAARSDGKDQLGPHCSHRPPASLRQVSPAGSRPPCLVPGCDCDTAPEPGRLGKSRRFVELWVLPAGGAGGQGCTWRGQSRHQNCKMLPGIAGVQQMERRRFCHRPALKVALT